MAQGISGGLVPAYATLAANIFAISAAFNFFKRASRCFCTYSSTSKSYATSTGVGLQSISSSHEKQVEECLHLEMPHKLQR